MRRSPSEARSPFCLRLATRLIAWVEEPRSPEGKSNSESSLKLPQSVAGRLVFAVICLVLLAASGFGVFGLTFSFTEWTSLRGLVVFAVIAALCWSLLGFSFAGLAWSAAKPAWAEHYLERQSRRLVLALAAFGLVSLPYVAWALYLGV